MPAPGEGAFSSGSYSGRASKSSPLGVTRTIFAEPAPPMLTLAPSQTFQAADRTE